MEHRRGVVLIPQTQLAAVALEQLAQGALVLPEADAQWDDERQYPAVGFDEIQPRFCYERVQVVAFDCRVSRALQLGANALSVFGVLSGGDSFVGRVAYHDVESAPVFSVEQQSRVYPRGRRVGFEKGMV